MERLIRPICRSPYQDLFVTDVVQAEALASSVVGQGQQLYLNVLAGKRAMPTQLESNLGPLLRQLLHARHIQLVGRGPRPPASYFLSHPGEAAVLSCPHSAVVWQVMDALRGDVGRLDLALEGLEAGTIGRALWAFLRLQRSLCYPPFQDPAGRSWPEVEALAAYLITLGEARYKSVLEVPSSMPQGYPRDCYAVSIWMEIDFIYSKRTGRGVILPPERYFL